MSAPTDAYRLVLLHDIMGAEVAIPIRRILDVGAWTLPAPLEGAEANARVTTEPVPGKTDVIEYVVRETPARVQVLVAHGLNGCTP